MDAGRFLAPSFFQGIHVLTGLEKLELEDCRFDALDGQSVVEGLTASIGKLTRLTSLQYSRMPLCPAAMHGWSSLQSLCVLQLCDVTFRWPDAVTTQPEVELGGFISHCRRLTRVDLERSSVASAFADVICHLSCLPCLVNLTATSYSAPHFQGMAALTGLTMLSWDISDADIEPTDIPLLNGLTNLQHLFLRCQGSGSSVRLVPKIAISLPLLRSLDLTLSTAAQEVEVEVAFEAIASGMIRLSELYVKGTVTAGSLAKLTACKSLAALVMVATVGDEELQQVARIETLERFTAEGFTGTAVGLEGLKRMPILRRVVFRRALHDELKGVLPRKLLE